jgi:hypothetical protein
MHELGIQAHIRGRDNIGDPIIGKGDATFSTEHVNQSCDSMSAHASLHCNAPDPLVLTDHAGLIQILTEWYQNDDHDKKDPGHNGDLGDSIAGQAIVARNQ